jgi:hypothetical protein
MAVFNTAPKPMLPRYTLSDAPPQPQLPCTELSVGTPAATAELGAMTLTPRLPSSNNRNESSMHCAQQNGDISLLSAPCKTAQRTPSVLPVQTASPRTMKPVLSTIHECVPRPQKNSTGEWPKVLRRAGREPHVFEGITQEDCERAQARLYARGERKGCWVRPVPRWR